MCICTCNYTYVYLRRILRECEKYPFPMFTSVISHVDLYVDLSEIHTCIFSLGGNECRAELYAEVCAHVRKNLK